MLMTTVIQRWYEQNDTNKMERAPPTIGELFVFCGQPIVPMRPARYADTLYSTNMERNGTHA